MLTLMLVAALCTSSGCDYMDNSDTYNLKTDDDCRAAAKASNTLNRLALRQVRYSCVSIGELKELREAPRPDPDPDPDAEPSKSGGKARRIEW